MEKGKQFDVLDHGYVKFIDSMSTDETIVEAARMSTGRGFVSWEHYERCKTCGALWRIWPFTVEGDGKPSASLMEGEKCGPCCDNQPMSIPDKFEIYPTGDMGLLDNLWRHKHATPFEMCELTLEVQAPIMVFREWHRHRTQSYNEFSARYAQMPNLHYVPERERIKKQSTTNKQGSDVAMDDVWAMHFITEIHNTQQDIYDRYDKAVEQGLAKEVARLNTPVSRYSKMRAKTDLRNWLAFLNLRMRPGAQWEIRQYANIVGDIIKDLWPKVWGLFEEYDLYGAHLSRSEMKALRRLLESPAWKKDLSLVAEKEGITSTKKAEFLNKLEFGGTKIL